jgi:SAM-dependent methyltransferase
VTAFELAYRCAEPFLPPLYGMVRRRLLVFAREFPAGTPRILDVGGRKSHYTIGVPARITVTELPRISDTQVELNLGLTESMMAVTRARRTNIAELVFDDMTDSKLDSASFDAVVAVEVLEHVERDRDFVRHVSRVLRPGGTFLMTTPNGDNDPVPGNPDHKRHYTRAGLANLLGEFLEDVRVDYAIVSGRARSVGLRSWSLRHPIKTASSMAGNFVNAMQSTRSGVSSQAIGTKHLIATASRGA